MFKLTRKLLPLLNFSRATMSTSKLETIALFKKAQAVCFDVDSTVIKEEGIDVLAAYKGSGAQVAELTSRAMGGNILFQDALSERLSIIKPSLEDIKNCMNLHPFQFTPGIKDLITKLQSRGTYVYLVSGGFRQMIYPIADQLNIPRLRVYANNILFDNNGSYVGFDKNELTSKDGGKPAVISKLKNDYGYNPIIMIGDGATDMQAKPPADAFIGFGGVVEREKVKLNADWYIYDFEELIAEV